ncbi:MAG: protein translocase subunit SecD [bacterium]
MASVSSRNNSMSPRTKVWLTFLFIIVLAFLAVAVDIPQKPSWLNWFQGLKPQLGLDLKGGAHLVYEANVSAVPSQDLDTALTGVRDVIERRVNAFGVTEPVVQTSKVGNHYRVIVDLPGVTDVTEAIKQIGETPLLEFKEENPSATVNPSLTPVQQQQLDRENVAAKAEAEDLLRQILNKGDFEALAKANSEDPGSAAKGGDLGFVKKGQFVPEFDKAIFDDLKAGEISKKLIKSAYGYHIIQKMEERGSGADKEVKSRHILVKTKTAADIVPPVDPWKTTALSGRQLKSARVQFDQTTGTPQVAITFNKDGSQLFADITRRNLNKPVAIFLDGQAISIPTVQSEITDGEAVISGNFSIKDAKTLAARLNAGALPVPISLVSQSTVGPSLGKTSVDSSVTAGLFGLLLVAVFMLVFYRLSGLLAVLALGVYSLLTFAVFILIPVTLTAAGIAGFILSIGMAVDANILIFERMKEEVRWGKSVPDAVEEGFKRAWTSIRDSNVSSLITCVILLWFGSSIIKGFALTLGIGILISMFSAITVSRTLLRLVAYGRLKRFPRIFSLHPPVTNH